MSSSSLGAHPPSDSSCLRSSCRCRLSVIVSKITKKKNHLEHLHTNMPSPNSSFPIDPSLDPFPVLRTLVVIMWQVAMSARYDLIKCINAGPAHKVWKLKVRVIRFWTVSQFVKYGMKAPIEMVVLDEEVKISLCI
ncbi:uncharacterized protein DS421_12g369090 [Arachis hypogaea]|nr:uncharacterized protein DS421_12g369090 [Arachis hypogaea]